MNYQHFLTFPVTLRQLEGTRRPDERRRFGRHLNHDENASKVPTLEQGPRAASG
jgi:hypothetical protein